MKRLQLARLLMVGTILAIGGFQGYWLSRIYRDEQQSLHRQIDILFQNTFFTLQMQQLKLDPGPDSVGGHSVFLKTLNLNNGPPMATLRSVLGNDTVKVLGERTDAKRFVFQMKDVSKDSSREIEANLPALPDKGVTGSFLSSVDSIPPSKVDSAYRKALIKNGIFIPFTLVRAARPSMIRTTDYLDLHRELGYNILFGSPAPYLIRKMVLPILFSLSLLVLTMASLVFLYRNLLAQQRLTIIKNEFIGNITHELKTPIATVNVAIEALRRFNALEDRAKTDAYLDISAAELRRLSLMVDKVLRLSMFENHEINLQRVPTDLALLSEEVMAGMRVQTEGAGATIELQKDGQAFIVEGDPHHLASVLYNLLDNALKYSRTEPVITIRLVEGTENVEWSISDNGLGIPDEYQSRIFDKFFRVPTGDRHDIRGYGLGLSYVYDIIARHKGKIGVKSKMGAGSAFVILLPATPTA